MGLDLQGVATICHGQGICGEALWLVYSGLVLCYSKMHIIYAGKI